MSDPRYEPLVELASLLGQQSDYDEVLEVITQKAVELLRADSGVVMMINPQTRQTIKTVFKNANHADDRQQHRIQTYVSGWIIKHVQPFASQNLPEDNRFPKSMFKNTTPVAVLGAPLFAEGVLLGTLIVQHAQACGSALEGELEFLRTFAAVVAPFLRNVQRVQQYFAPPARTEALLQKYSNLGMYGRSAKFVKMLHTIEAAARCDVRVLLQGQSGTGKELIASAIHKFSSRNAAPFIAIDCGAIPANLVESELFGHTKGAFTGATSDRKGLIEEANCGTLFMDEIVNLPLDVQSKLMRFLQEGEVRPVGSNRARTMDVRIIAASSTNLHDLVEKHVFREDLYYRLFVYPINIPSLDERQEDIALLAHHFLQTFARQQNKALDGFHEELLDFMLHRHWAGNIRELENFIERLVALTPADHTQISHTILPDDLRREFEKTASARHDLQVSKSLAERLAEYESQIIRQTLVQCDWNQSLAARQLKISEQTIRYKMGKLNIFKPNL